MTPRTAVLCILLALAIPAQAKRVTLAREVAVDFPESWVVQQDTRDTLLATHTMAGAKSPDATMTVHLERRRTHEEALQRLAQFATEHPPEPGWRVLAGWPALERKVSVAFQYPGQEEQMPRGHADETSLRVTTAIAAGTLVIRFQTLLQPDANPKIADEALEIGRTVDVPRGDAVKSEEEVRRLREGASRPKVQEPASHGTAGSGRRPTGGGGGGKPEGGASMLVNGRGEIEAAVSMNGTDMVTDAACSLMFSSSGGAAFNASTRSGAPAQPGMDGDCTLAWGPSGNFYLSILGNQWIGLWSSIDHGANFNYLTLDVNRVGVTNVDQPHLAAHRWNSSGSSQDRVYVTWHETPSFVARVACSSDSGATWSAPVDAHSGNFGFPRVAVGPDGMVYVVSRNGANVVLDKFSACDPAPGLTEQAGFPISMAIADVPCPVAGLDRCNNGNTLSSPTIAVDDTDANHVYLAWSQTSGSGQNVVVADSTNGGLNFGAPVAVNAAVTGVRYEPWIGAWGGVAYAGWYDRRTATAAAVDRTRYYRGSASVVHGALTSGTEFDLTGTNDSQCSGTTSGIPWPCGTRSPSDATSCNAPQLAGFCSVSFTRCNFAAPACPVGQICQTSGGCPKYGDYNGLALGGGRLLNIWASGTAPSDLPATGNNNIQAYVSVTDLPQEFYVRDWTDDAMHFDRGNEPSTHGDFYSASDVWNQIHDTPDAPAGGYTVGTDAQRGPGAAGDNFAFARVSRRAPAASTVPDTNVTLHFLVSDFGAGLPFVPAGAAPDPTLTFHAADQTVTLQNGYQWHLDMTASTHVCLLVEMSASGDPGLPTLNGNSPGAGAGDPIVLADNNKAQRNLWTAPGAGGGGGGGGGWMAHAVIRNDQREAMQIPLAYRIPHDLFKRFEGATIGVAGGGMQPLRERGELTLPTLRPGETRVLLVNLGRFKSEPGELLPIEFSEMIGGRVRNGFTIAATTWPLPRLLAWLMREHFAVMTRLAGSDRAAAQEAKDSEKLAASRDDINPKVYRGYLAGHAKAAAAVAARFVRANGGKDPFRLGPASTKLIGAAKGDDDETLAAAHQAFLDLLDAAITQGAWERRKE
jgi:hypothetical protein